MDKDPNFRFSYKFKEELKIEKPKQEIDIEDFNPV